MSKSTNFKNAVLVSLMLSLGVNSTAISDETKNTDDQATEAEHKIDTSAHLDVTKINAKKAYQSTNDVMRDVNANLERARNGNKMSLIIVGANWCHDSTGMIQKLQDEEVSKTLASSYEVSIVDAGFLTKGFDVAQRFGLPIYYATPTVLVIDPKTEKLVNGSDMDQWKNADAIPVEDYRSYFTKYSSLQSIPKTKTSKLTKAQKSVLAPVLKEIDAFEAHQVKRIAAGYKIVGPMLAAKPRPENMMDIWMEVRNVRFNLPNDVAELRAEATAQALAGKKKINIIFPEYGKYSWE